MLLRLFADSNKGNPSPLGPTVLTMNYCCLSRWHSHTVCTEHKDGGALQPGLCSLSLPEHMCASPRLSPPSSPLPLCFSGRHIMLLSQAGGVTACR